MKAAAILFWGLIFIALFIFKTVPLFTDSVPHVGVAGIFASFAHADDNGDMGAVGGDIGDGSDVGNDNMGSNDNNGTGAADGGGCGDCGGFNDNTPDVSQPTNNDIEQGVSDHVGYNTPTVYTPVCPAGTTGTYPNCTLPHYNCPAGTTGTYPNCVVPNPVCPSGTTGTYPNCSTPNPVCPSGTVGTYPNCIPPTYNPNCPSGTVGTYPNCYVPQPTCYYNCGGYYIPPTYIPPTVYPPQYYPNPTPFVTLSAVPYTGLDLGFGGTVVYWSFLILLALLAAYLVIVVRVQTKVVGWLGGALFAETPADSHAAHTHSEHVVHTHLAETPAVQEDVVDDFIMSQVSRAR